MNVKSKPERSSLFIISVVALAVELLAAGCAHPETHADTAPAWTALSPRSVEGDRISYIAGAEGKQLDRARAEAEATALEDIANECSLVPNSIKKENEYFNDDEKASSHSVKVRYSVSKADCLKAQSTFAPEEIRIFANVAATQKILKHQDAVGEANDPLSSAQEPVKAGDLEGLINARQQIALQKQAVILAGPTHYRLHSGDSKRFYAKVKADTDPLLVLGKQSGVQAMTLSWSSTHGRDTTAVPVPVLSQDISPAASPTPLPTTGKRKGPKATPKSFPKN